MRNDDLALIQRILAGDTSAFENLIRKYQKQVHAYAFRKVGDFQIAEDNYPGDFPASLSETRNAKRSSKVFKLALCDCEPSVYRMAPKKSVTDRVAARDPYLRNRSRCVFSIRRCRTRKNDC